MHSTSLRIVAFSATMIALASAAPAQTPAPAMRGVWTGDARIFVNWTTQKTLNVRFAIDSTGRVTGLIGDAELVDGRFLSNRGWLGRTLHVKTDYIIEGKLRGPIIAAEDVERETVKIPLTWNGTGFTGSVSGLGWVAGPAKHSPFVAGNLVLKKASY